MPLTITQRPVTQLQMKQSMWTYNNIKWDTTETTEDYERYQPMSKISNPGE